MPTALSTGLRPHCLRLAGGVTLESPSLGKPCPPGKRGSEQEEHRLVDEGRLGSPRSAARVLLPTCFLA